MNKVSAIALMALLIVPAQVGAMSRTGPVHISHPVVGEVSGNTVVKGTGQPDWEQVERGTLLLSGDTVRTGPRSRAHIRFAVGSMVLYEDTEIQIPTIGAMERIKDIRDLVVNKGSVFLDVSGDVGAGAFSFKTDDMRGRTSESLLTISRRDSGSSVNVYRGEAEVSHGNSYLEKTSSLVPGTSIVVTDRSDRHFRFDPKPALKNLRRKQAPRLDTVTGLQREERSVDTSDTRQDGFWSRVSPEDRLRDSVSAVREPPVEEGDGGTDEEGEAGEDPSEDDTVTVDTVSGIVTDSVRQYVPAEL